ncbi:hypothetical protein [Haloarcula onubensis]|uniref:Uncharacterized protein n=1 Tax=Haloarcula onubensis TaxID=2950539 RepID=A0ABU2FTC9_9EURY|nr:hypothetical protein [Halomicroarcula sp. S3CR25-11]MDS0284024.1 hypothetical protein [Halomicroarcula sp. S3CR25-11]
MTDSYNLPLVGGCGTLRNSSLMAVDDDYMRRPTESGPVLFELLPNSAHVDPLYTVAGAHAGCSCNRDFCRSHSGDASHAVTALYTPTGELDYQERILACRINILEEDQEYSDSIDEFHEEKIDDAFEDGERAAYTDWIDASLTHDTVNGYQRTAFTRREPILSYPPAADRDVSRPVLVTAFVVQTTPWGVIEVGTYHWPDPDPGSGLATVTDLADTVMSRASRLPRPETDPEWPLFYGYEETKAELADELRTTIAELTAEPSPLTPEPGAALTNLNDRFHEQYGATRRETAELLRVLEANDEIKDATAGAIQLT